MTKIPVTEERRKLKDGEYWCLYPRKRDKEPPTLLLNPGPYFEGNAAKNRQKIAVVRLVEASPDNGGAEHP
jgi:hypothetical protein